MGDEAIRFFLQDRAGLQHTYLARLKQIRATLESSEWFAHHEVVGSSLLFVYDSPAAMESRASNAVECKMIDFAKTSPLLGDQKLTHKADWVMGNREDGYLTGLDDLISLWEKLECSAP